METADLARENALLKARLAEVEATLDETQEANQRPRPHMHCNVLPLPIISGKQL